MDARQAVTFAHRLIRGLVVAVLLVGVLGAAAPAAAKPARDAYIVVLRDSVPSAAAAAARLERAHGFRTEHVYGHALKGFAARLGSAQLASVSADPAVAFVSPDREVRIAGQVPVLPGDSSPTGVRRIGAASATQAHQASTAAVAVIDTGVALTHPDLNVASGKNCTTPKKTAPAADDNGHGTHVAGTIGAENDGSGVVGVAPGTRIYAVKVLNASGQGTWSQVICGIDWVTQKAGSLGIKVANMSLAGFGFADGLCGNLLGDALNRAICRSTAAGVTYVVAAGNSGQEFSTTVPAAYPEVLTVTAMSDSDGAGGALGGAPTCRTGESDDSYASFSNFADPTDSGGQAHMVAGPGVCIESSWLGGGYRVASGTSMATPHVTGTVALCFGSGGTPGPCAGRTPAGVIERIRSDAAAAAPSLGGFVGDPNNPVPDRYFGPLVSAAAY
jgi:subtilisin family serine protease